MNAIALDLSGHAYRGRVGSEQVAGRRAGVMARWRVARGVVVAI